MKWKLQPSRGEVHLLQSSLPRRRSHCSCATRRNEGSGKRLVVASRERIKRGEEREEKLRTSQFQRVICSAFSEGERGKGDDERATAAAEEERVEQEGTGNTKSKPVGTLQSLSTKYGLTLVLFVVLVGYLSGSEIPGLQCFLFSWLAVVLLSRWMTPKMRRLKQTFQEDGPASHSSSKKGTPTAGGILFIPVGLLVGWVYAWPLAKEKVMLVGVSFCTLACHFIGGIDDAMIITQKANKGLSPKWKLLLQMATGVAFCAVVSTNYTKVVERLPFLRSATLRGVYYMSALFLIAGESNAVNLTDGIDGLAAGLFAISAIGMAMALIHSPYTNQALALVCISMSGACCGFLSQNGHPAKIFMGDTGSLALGAFLSSVAVCTGAIFPFLFLTMVFNLEMFSVMIQVGYFKWTKARFGEGKRFFRMAPFHHHLELCGWSERNIVLTFYAVALVTLFCNGNPVLPF